MTVNDPGVAAVTALSILRGCVRSTAQRFVPKTTTAIRLPARLC